MSLAESNAFKSKALGLTAGLALLVGLAGAGLAANQHVSAQSPTATATATRTATAAPTAPTTGTGNVDSDDMSFAIPIVALAVVLLGGGVAFALAGRNQG